MRHFAVLQRCKRVCGVNLKRSHVLHHVRTSKHEHDGMTCQHTLSCDANSTHTACRASPRTNKGNHQRRATKAPRAQCTHHELRQVLVQVVRVDELFAHLRESWQQSGGRCAINAVL